MTNYVYFYTTCCAGTQMCKKDKRKNQKKKNVTWQMVTTLRSHCKINVNKDCVTRSRFPSLMFPKKHVYGDEGLLPSFFSDSETLWGKI